MIQVFDDPIQPDHLGEGLMQESKINVKSVVLGFCSYLGMVTILLPLIVEITGHSKIVLNLLLVIFPLIAGFITAANAKKSETLNGLVLGLLIILMGFISFWLVSTQSRNFKHKFDLAFILPTLLAGVAATAGSVLRKCTKRKVNSKFTT